MEHRTHPVTILANLWRVLYLVIIPVLRGFFLALQRDLAAWASGAWIDILIFLAMIAFAVVRWMRVTYRYNCEGIILYKGVLFRRGLQIAWEKVATISAVETFYLKPFRAVRLQADTLGGQRKDMDLSIILRPAAAAALMQQCRVPAAETGVVPRRYVPHTGSIWALALLTSNSFGGILFIATFISQSGKLLGNEFSEMIIGTFEEAARLLAFGIPPAAAAIAYVLLAGWFIGFLFTFVRYKNFVVTYKMSDLNITCGIFTKREYIVKCDSVSCIDIRQSIITKVLGWYTLYIYAVGYGKLKNDIACIVPCEKRESFTASRELLLPAFQDCPRQVRPSWKGIFRFVSDPLVWIALITATMGVTVYLVPSWYTFTLFVGLMSLVPVLLFLAVRIVEFATGGFAIHNGYYTIRYSKGLSIHKVIVSADKVVKVRLQQSLFQRFGENCDLIIYTKGEGRTRHKCRNLNRKALAQLLKMQ